MPGMKNVYCSVQCVCSCAYRDTLIVVVLDALTSIFAGFAIFSIIGYLAHTLSKSVDNVVQSGAYAGP